MTKNEIISGTTMREFWLGMHVRSATLARSYVRRHWKDAARERGRQSRNYLAYYLAAM